MCTTSMTCHEHLADAGIHLVELPGGGLVTVHADGRVSVVAPHPVDDERFSPTGVLVNAQAGFVEVHPGGPALSQRVAAVAGEVAVPLPRMTHQPSFTNQPSVTNQHSITHEHLEVSGDRARSRVPGKVFVSLADGSVVHDRMTLTQRDEQYRTYMASEAIAAFNDLG